MPICGVSSRYRVRRDLLYVFKCLIWVFKKWRVGVYDEEYPHRNKQMGILTDVFLFTDVCT